MVNYMCVHWVVVFAWLCRIGLWLLKLLSCRQRCMDKKFYVSWTICLLWT